MSSDTEENREFNPPVRRSPIQAKAKQGLTLFVASDEESDAVDTAKKKKWSRSPLGGMDMEQDFLRGAPVPVCNLQ
ncbi:hypothetical protein NEUTE1DRAFT_125599 [Neurospora tetrasperma FGSC 2508]|uniref:Uncharacterized protein n=1 Tax=Neurospora tetrasperma (strain FGSC 2508 / ATCC MYA-4615 / P0657) TaxID=510951 RepID=F8MZE0_NEUT8|nr:uncharacterized protein NEUTE1DRAFT_125599 [Neurospora tetrasperma FGSC 2508]EGO52031.1 hypothetical protein NEUTE1DRAFT_125599 [Neurospora tetrasperma FGSC 2508]